MTVFITGVNGFIGQYLAKEFHKNGDTVIGCGTKSEAISKDVDQYFQWDVGYSEVPHGLLNVEIDHIIHAAASLDKDDDNIGLIYTNCVGAHRIYHLAKEKRVKSVVLLGSIPISGLHCRETINEWTYVDPQTMYHATKASQELILKQLNKSGVRFCSLRVPSPIGPGQPVKTIVPVFVNNAVKNIDITISGRGTRKQNYVDVRDIARCIRYLCLQKQAEGVFCIASDETISNYDLAEMCVKLSNSESIIKLSGSEDPCDDDDWKVDTSKLKRLGFSLHYTIKDTLNDMISFAGKNL